MTHDLAMLVAFGVTALVGLVLMVMSMTSLSVEGRVPGMVLMTVCMAGLFLFGLAGMMGELPWLR
jgi:hypothetical protein